MSDNAVLVRKLLAAAVQAGFQSGSLTPTLQVSAVYDTQFDLTKLTGGRVVIVPEGLGTKLLTRGAAQRKDCSIDVAVQYKFATPTDSELDPYLSLAESLSDYLLGLQLRQTTETTQPRTVATCLATALPHGLWYQEHVEKFKVLTTVIRATFAYST